MGDGDANDKNCCTDCDGAGASCGATGVGINGVGAANCGGDDVSGGSDVRSGSGGGGCDGGLLVGVLVVVVVIIIIIIIITSNLFTRSKSQPYRRISGAVFVMVLITMVIVVVVDLEVNIK